MKKILIVGGSSGIGRAVVDRVVDRGDEAVVIARERRSLPASVTFCQADILSDSLAEHVPEELDGLVYCPGSIHLAPIARISEQQILDDLRLNAVGAVKAIQAAIPSLKKRPGSAIVLFSTVAVKMGMPFHTSVAMAKGAVEGLAKSLAAELAPAIRVNAIAPSITDTPLAARLLGDEKRRTLSAERHPLHRVGSVNDVASAVMFALYDATWTTGSVIPVDGGLGELSANK